MNGDSSMTLAEFKAWFEGFTEDMDGPPDAKQWKRIKARVKDIDGTAITRHVYVDHYWPRAVPYTPYWGDMQFTCQSIGIGTAMSGNAVSSNDMIALGKADYSTLAAGSHTAR